MPWPVTPPRRARDRLRPRRNSYMTGANINVDWRLDFT
jgi:hypothetical protein